MTWVHYSSFPGCPQTRLDVLLSCGNGTRLAFGILVVKFSDVFLGVIVLTA